LKVLCPNGASVTHDLLPVQVLNLLLVIGLLNRAPLVLLPLLPLIGLRIALVNISIAV
jgi:hypothetical protein